MDFSNENFGRTYLSLRYIGGGVTKKAEIKWRSVPQ